MPADQYLAVTRDMQKNALEQLQALVSGTNAGQEGLVGDYRPDDMAALMPAGGSSSLS